MWKENSKYKKIYDSIVERATTLERKKGFGVYFEKHHVVPLSLGGERVSTNEVLLTGREHFLCHWLLVKGLVDTKNINKMKYALWRMTNLPIRGERIITSWQYEIARRSISEARRSSRKNTYVPSKKGSVEHRLKMSVIRRGKKIGPSSEESKEKKRSAMLEIWSDNNTRTSRISSIRAAASTQIFKDKCAEASRKRWDSPDSRDNIRPENSVFSVKRWLSLGYDEKDAMYEVRSRKPSCLEYWMKKGMTEMEAIEARSKHQRRKND